MLKNCKTAILLAGGQSKRMGFDKINIPYKGSRLLDYQINELKKLFTEIIIVSNDLKEYDDERVKIVCDEYKQIGPLAGLHVGLKHATSPYSYIVACDMPFLNHDFIELMDDLLVDFHKDILISRVNGYLEPFNAVYHKSLYQQIESLVSTNEIYGLKDLIKRANYQIIDQAIVELYGIDMFHNLNTIADIKKYLEIDVV